MSSPDTHADEPDLAALGALLADRNRAAFCLALLDGRAWTATELAQLAGIAPSTATSHLNRLVTGGLLAEERKGRHRYVRLADPAVAEMIEALAARAPQQRVPVRSLVAARRHRAVTFARICYDHLGGALSVAITDAMTEQGYLDWEFGPALTPSGAAWLTDTDITEETAPHVRTCLDWTERRLHLAGGVAAAVFHHAVDKSWLVLAEGSRVVRLTDQGRDAFRRHLHLTDEALTAR
ncbi:ArsR/SmtB family transcription factor [Streptomyces cavernicola]|uniref:Helix-turn-helix domain-containing protein n=1 Tax=Streptomyces cavernicola TaxID=3043613 RepID=A0ABT6SFB6_9ACTN|nr:helix-turn-helix domain-containing protein [Streptomyces sp. B-S-A6]MDI3406881.1 helix-turn-helix domain-containing protein [Streptomyces sp. B-S-A6]